MNFQLRWILLLGVVGFCISILHSAGEKSLWSIQQTLSSKRYVDLTHAFEPGIPRWPGFPDEMRKTIYWYEKRSEEHTSELQSRQYLVCRLLLEKKKNTREVD